MKRLARAVVVVLSVAAFAGLLHAQTNAGHSQPTAQCAGNDKPYRDFDFIVGTWDFRTLDGQKVVLEGTMYPTNGSPSARIRGVWTPQADGSIRKEFLRLDEKANQWVSFFAGFAHPR